MKPISTISLISVAVFAFLSIGADVAKADTYTEIGDAGKTIPTAQLVNAGPPFTQLTNILGFLGPSDADIFEVFLTDGQTFSATTDSNSSNFFDTQLFLFDSTGKGVYANDDDTTSPPQSTLPAFISLTPSASGTYYLAIAGSGFLPISAGGFIFPSTAFLGLLDPGVVGPTGPGGVGSPLTNWLGVSSETGNYNIALTGAQFLGPVPVPEPAAGWLIGGVFVLIGLLRGFSRQA